MRSRVASIVAWPVAVTALAIALPFPVAVARAERVGSISFEGAQAASARQLRQQLFTTSRPWWKPWEERPELSEEAVQQDAERLESHYRALGYFEAQVSAEVARDADSDVADVVFHIEEGPPILLAERGIEVPAELSALAPSGSLVEGLPLVVGEVFSLERYNASKTELLARLAEQGRPRAEVVGGADVYVPQREAKLTWRVVPGPIVRFGPVRVVGLDEIDEELVRREITLEEGAVYSLSALRETRDQVQSLRLFRSVVARPRPDEAIPAGPDQAIWPVDLEVRERPRHALRLGLGYGTDDGPRVQAAYTHRNLLGGARLFEATGRYSRLERSFSGTLEQPHWLARRQRLLLESSLGQQTTPAYDADRMLGGVHVTRAFGERWSIRAGYELSWARIRDADDDAGRFLEDPERSVFLSGLRLGVRRTTVENPLDPRGGSWLDLAVAPFLGPLGSDESFVRAVAEGRLYQPIRSTVLAARLQLATIEPFGATRAGDVPLTERLYLGGASTVRGFEYWRLGPSEADGDPIGGTSSVLASLEWRFPVREPVAGVLFVDAGKVALDPHAFGPRDLTFSTGFGIRLATPLGPIRLDIAFPLNAPDDAKETFFHLSIGQAF